THICMCLPQLNLVCGRKHPKETSQSVYLARLLIGALTFGPLCDWIGRKATILVQLLLFAILGMAAAFVPGFELYTALHFAVATAVVGYNFSSITLRGCRVGGALVENSGCGPGPVHLLHGADGPRRTHPWRPELEALPDGWRCTCLPLFLYFWALPETARWLPTRGRVEEAKQPIQRVASVNKRKLSPELLSQPGLPGASVCTCLPDGPREDRPHGECPGSVPTPPALEGDPDSLLCLPSLRPKLKGCHVSVDGGCLGTTGSPAGYSLEYFGLGLKLIFREVEVPTRYSSIFVVERLGLKWSQLGTRVLGGVMHYHHHLCPGRYQGWPPHPNLLPRPVVSFSGTGMGLVGILKPLVILLGEYHTALPMLIYGSLPIGAGLLCALLPETRGQTLKDTIDDLEQESCPHALGKGFRGLRKYFWPGVAFRAARTSECVSEARPEAAESCLNTPLGTAGPVSMTTLLTEAAPQELAPEPASQPLPSPIPEASETGLPPFKTFLIPRAPRPIPCSDLESW
ncbi:hypothetical protein E2I00_017563, partial [Balaenoptera physalus]